MSAEPERRLRTLRRTTEMPDGPKIHDDLDATVFAAYGWPATLSDEEILERLVALNHERAEEEKRGIVRWLRPEFQNRRGETQLELEAGQGDTDGEDPEEARAGAADQPAAPAKGAKSKKGAAKRARPRCRRMPRRGRWRRGGCL
jgi:hypothetical protein